MRSQMVQVVPTKHPNTALVFGQNLKTAAFNINYRSAIQTL